MFLFIAIQGDKDKVDWGKAAFNTFFETATGGMIGYKGVMNEKVADIISFVGPAVTQGLLNLSQPAVAGAGNK